QMLNHRVVATPAEAAQKAMQAGVHIDLHSGTYKDELPDLVETGAIDKNKIDNAVKKVLRLKYKLGLFDHSFAYGDKSSEQLKAMVQKHRPLAREASQKSIVLLKNDTLPQTHKAVLPLAKDRKSLAVIGPLVKNKKA